MRRVRKGESILLWHDLTKAVWRWFANTDGLVWVKLDMLPNTLVLGTLYILGKGTSLRAIAMQCPCGCGENIYINVPNAHPCLTVTHHSDGTVSLHPTIRRLKGCHSHFFVRRSRVYWWNIGAQDARPSAETAAGCSATSSLPSRQFGRLPV